jgi:hypothetical protein
MFGASGLCEPQEYVRIDEETYGCDWVLETPQVRARAASVMHARIAAGRRVSSASTGARVFSVPCFQVVG